MASDIDQMLAQAAAGGGGAGSSGPPVPVRFPGLTPYVAGNGASANSAEHSSGTKVPRVELMDPDAASVAINGWAEDDQRAVAKKMWSLGLISSPQDLMGAYQAWDMAVKIASRFSAAGNPMEVGDVMELMADGSPDAIKRRAQIANAGKTIVTQKANPLDLTDPMQVRMMLEQAFQTKMGRDPTEAEINTAVASLHAEQTKNPGMSRTSTTYDENGNITQQQQLPTSGGIDPSAFLQEQAAADPEAAEYQASSVYFPLLMQALGAPAGLGG